MDPHYTDQVKSETKTIHCDKRYPPLALLETWDAVPLSTRVFPSFPTMAALASTSGGNGRAAAAVPAVGKGPLGFGKDEPYWRDFDKVKIGTIVGKSFITASTKPTRRETRGTFFDTESKSTVTRWSATIIAHSHEDMVHDVSVTIYGSDEFTLAVVEDKDGRPIKQGALFMVDNVQVKALNAKEVR